MTQLDQTKHDDFDVLVEDLPKIKFMVAHYLGIELNYHDPNYPDMYWAHEMGEIQESILSNYELVISKHGIKLKRL